MSVSALQSVLYAALLSDEETAAHFSDVAEIGAMLSVEGALARVQGRLGIVPAEAARRIASTLDTLAIEPAALGAGTASAGVPVPALVKIAREAVGGDAGAYVHWGATSQDIVDTGLVLRLRPVLELFETRLAVLIERLAESIATHRDCVLAARTRSQQATPTTFGLKVAGWTAPLVRHRRRLRELRPRLLVVQLGGASGNLAAFGSQGAAVMDGLAAELGLESPPMPWHTQRDALAELAGWLSLVSASLGKLGQDLVLLAQSEVGEVRPGSGGGSSTMPQKANPVAAEILVTLARLNAGLVANAHQAMLQEHERGGAGWSLEWLTLPQMTIATGAALAHADRLLDSLVVDSGRMALNVERSNGLILAEAATFALAEHMPRPRAQALVEAACQDALSLDRHLVDVLAQLTDAAVDWEGLRDAASHVGVAPELARRVLQDLRTG